MRARSSLAVLAGALWLSVCPAAVAAPTSLAVVDGEDGPVPARDIERVSSSFDPERGSLSVTVRFYGVLNDEDAARFWAWLSGVNEQGDCESMARVFAGTDPSGPPTTGSSYIGPKPSDGTEATSKSFSADGRELIITLTDSRLIGVRACGLIATRLFDGTATTFDTTLDGRFDTAPPPKPFVRPEPTPPRYRVVRDAIAVRHSSGGFEVYWRMNRALPRQRRNDFGHLDPDAPLKVMAYASLSGHSLRWGAPGWIKPRARYCYYQQVDSGGNDPDLRASRIGTRVPFAVRVRGVRRAVRGKALLVKYSTGERRPAKRLGC